jgi:hypothetical protein
MRLSLLVRPALLLSLAATITIAPDARGQSQTATATGRDSSKALLVRQLLREIHAVDMSVTAMEASLPAQRAANPRIPAVFWDRFAALARARAPQLEDVLATVYDHHFTADELRQLLAFYRSPIGRKMLEEQPGILRESMAAGQQWGQKVGAEVGEQLAAEGVRIQP